MPDALLVVAKRPAPGRTKTRLCPPLSFEQAASLYECFLMDTLTLMRQVPGVSPMIVFLPEDESSYFQTLAPDFRLFAQQGEALGERLDHLLTRALDEGAGKVVVMNSDSPNLPAGYLTQAFKYLDEAEIVLGPAEDGGYYLIGMKKPHPRLLRDVEMSTPHVLRDTLHLAKAEELRVAILPEWYDVDTVEALNHLRMELDHGSDSNCAQTRQWFNRYADLILGV